MNGPIAMLLRATSLLPRVSEEGTFWLPPQASTVADEVDVMFYVIFWICVFFFVGIVAAMLLFVYKYKKPDGGKAEPSAHHNTLLEVTWSVIPLILVIVIFYVGFAGFMNMTTPPKDAYEIQVTGQKWKWLFTYPNGYIDENLHVPVDTPVKLTMSSEDVIHSFYIPAFRLKQDVVPGRYTHLWFEASREGVYQMYCAEYCGKSHSDMLAMVEVHEPGGFEKWLEDASNFLDRMAPAEAGELLYKSRGCKQCHSIDGSGNTGPTFKGLFGHDVVLNSGETVTADENYIRESILEPQAKVVAGFQAVMPTFQGRLKDREIGAIIEYMKTLK